MQAIWKGAISFGLVTIPVALYSATSDRKPSFKMLHGADNGSIKFKRVCEIDGEEVPFADIVKGYEVEKGSYVVFTDEELDSIGKALSGTVDVVQFVDAAEIDPIYFKKSYYLAPDTKGLKAYRILLRALQDKGKVGLARVGIREREYLATVRAEEDVLVLETMWWPDEIREPLFEGLDTEVEIRKEEMQMAGLLIDNLAGAFDPSAWTDASREAVEEMARRKVEGREIIAPSAPEPTKVVDLLDALKASVEAAKARKAAG